MTAGRDAREGRARWAARGLWLAICLYVFARLDRAGRGLTFFYDEWDWVLNRRTGVRSLLLAHNGHFSLVPALAFRVLLHTAGLAHYRPYRWTGLAVHLAVASAAALIVARRRGRISGLALGAVIALLGSGWENILWPFQIGMMGSLLFGLVAWLLLDHRTRRSDIAAAIALCLSIASSGPGIALTAGVAARIGWERARWRRLWVIAPAAVVYGAWWVGFGEPQGTFGNLRWTGSYVRDSAAGSIAALAGRNLDWGRFAIGVAASIAVGTVARRRRLTATAAGAVAATLLNWVLTTYARADLHAPDGSRYVYLGAVLLVVVWAELYPRDTGSGRTVDVVARGARRWTALTVVLALVGIRGNRHALEIGTESLRHTSALVGGELRAMEWARDVPAVYRPEPRWAPPFFAGRYFAAVRALHSSPAMPSDVLPVTDAAARAGADRVTLELAAPRAETAVEPGTDARCTVASSATEVTVNAGEAFTVSASTGIDVRLRRFADTFPDAPTLTLPAGATRLTPPEDDGPPTWHVEVRAATPVRLCGVTTA